MGHNSTKTGFGQVDGQQRLQGVGREVSGEFIYEGTFKDNVYHGWGRLVTSTYVFTGHYENGLRSGHGREVTTASGQVREGHWQQGSM